MEAKKHMAEGPFVFAAVMANGKNPSMVGSSVAALIFKVISACLVAWLLFQTRLDYNKSVVFIVVIGLVIRISCNNALCNLVWIPRHVCYFQYY